MKDGKAYYNIDIDKVFQELNSNKNGLDENDIASIRKKYGKNIIEEKKAKSKARVFLEQFQDILVIILIIAALISFFTGEVESTIVIFFVLSLNAILGTIQYFKAEKSLESLRNLSSPIAKVIRNGNEKKIPSEEVVLGDIVILENGDIVCADMRIIKANNLEINESSLTGESLSIEKNSETILKNDLPLGDQKNMAFSGSLVTNGRGLGVVTNIGMKTEIGKIALALKETKSDKTPLQNSLDNFSKYLAIVIIGICLIVFGLNIYRHMQIMDALMFAVALAVAAIPEALSTIVTIVLAIGTQKMAQEKAIVKQLKAVEGLGCVNVICTDKTGTLTQNKMLARQIMVNKKIRSLEEVSFNEFSEKRLLTIALLCNNAKYLGERTSTEAALLYLCDKCDVIHFQERYKRLDEIAFDSNRKIMSTLNFYDGKYLMLTKGAPDIILNKCSYIVDNNQEKKMSSSDKYECQRLMNKLSEEGLRVIAFAYKEILKRKSITKSDENDLVFVGMVGLIDPPKKEAKNAISDTFLAGIKPVMITGDYKITALAIAKEIGIYKENDLILTGSELSKMSDEDLDKVINKVSVYARVTPSDKIRIVTSWQRNNQVVAFIGDGVNDAPAIKRANIGIAMGQNGTEVSKDASSIILMDDNYSTIVKAIRNGRNIYDNIQNAIRFLISGNAAGIIAVIYTSLLSLPIPFAPVHLLFINLITDSLPAIAIGMEPMKKDLIKQKPRKSSEFLISKRVFLKIIIEGLLIALCTILSYYMGLKVNQYAARTCVFLTLCSARLFHSFNCRGGHSLFKDPIKNKAMYLSFFLGMLLLNIVLFVPSLQPIFKIWPLDKEQIISAYLLAFAPTFFIQVFLIIKDLIRKSH